MTDRTNTEAALLELVSGWRNTARVCDSQGSTGMAAGYDNCATDLEERLCASAADASSERSPPSEEQLWKLLPSSAVYLDPPDGGDVPLYEQLQRMAEDARKWREQRATPASAEASPSPVGEVTDAMVEAACVKAAMLVDGAIWPDDYGPEELSPQRAETKQILEAAFAAQAPKSARAGGEYVLVPREPTQAMLEAGWRSIRCDLEIGRKPQQNTATRAARNAYVTMLQIAIAAEADTAKEKS